MRYQGKVKPLAQSLYLQRRAEEFFPGGVNSPVRAFRAVGGHPPFVVRAEGATLFDADGNRYVDLFGSWGPMILGHAFPPVVEAIREAAGREFWGIACGRGQPGGAGAALLPVGGEDALRQFGDGGLHVDDPPRTGLYRAELRHQV